MKSKNLTSLMLQLANVAYALCAEGKMFLNFVGDVGLGLAEAFKNPRKVKWRTTFYYIDECGSDAVPIISLLGLLIGVILAFQAIVQLSRYGVDNYVVNLVGTIIVSELGPLVVAIVIAGRSGSAFAAELGTMKVSEEIDAIVTMGFSPMRFLIMPKMIALIIVMPLLTIFADVCGVCGGMLIACSKLGFSASSFYYKTIEVITPLDLFQGLFKSVFFALIISSIGCMKGLYTKRDARGVGKASTSAVITSIFLIIVADAIITSLFSIK